MAVDAMGFEISPAVEASLAIAAQVQSETRISLSPADVREKFPTYELALAEAQRIIKMKAGKAARKGGLIRKYGRDGAAAIILAHSGKQMA